VLKLRSRSCPNVRARTCGGTAFHGAGTCQTDSPPYEALVNLKRNLRPAHLVSIEGAITETLELLRIEPKDLPAKWYASRDESLPQVWIFG
jgi:hypothetical protein